MNSKKVQIRAWQIHVKKWQLFSDMRKFTTIAKTEAKIEQPQVQVIIYNKFPIEQAMRNFCKTL